jgi:ribosomal protein S18 acetylase RimI-like enzyme
MSDSASTWVQIQWKQGKDLNRDQLVDLLQRFGDFLPVPLASRFDLPEYAAKLQKTAEIGLAKVADDTQGLVVLYANDTKTKTTYIPIISVDPSFRGSGVGSTLLSRSIALARARQMNSLNLEVKKKIPERSSCTIRWAFGRPVKRQVTYK